jgi:predicted RNA-binding protein with PIN domain
VSAEAAPERRAEEAGGEPSPRALPQAVRKSLLRGLGSYLRSTPRAKLPGDVRRFAGFRQQALARHAPDLLEALARSEVSAGLLEWLDDESHNLSPEDVIALRTVAERSRGWFERLVDTGPAPTGTRAPDGSARRSALEKERTKAARARDDARRAREDARRSVQAERSKAAELTAIVRELRSELAEAWRARAAAEARVGRATDEAQRDVRRARRERDRARESSDALRREVKQERRKAAALQREVDALGRKLERLKSAPPPARRAERATNRKRRPLRTPPGRLPDDVDTLDEWLAHDDVHLVVDGYNVTKAPGGFGDLDLERQRQRLVDELERLARRRGIQATVVFDGSTLAPGVARRHRGVVEVHYSRPTEIADDHLVAVLEGLPPVAVVVVTNDRDLQRRVKALGATVAGSGQLLGLIR